MGCFTVNHNQIKASSIHLPVIIKRGDKLDIKAVCRKKAKHFPITVTCKRAKIQSYTLLEKISNIYVHKQNDNIYGKKLRNSNTFYQRKLISELFQKLNTRILIKIFDKYDNSHFSGNDNFLLKTEYFLQFEKKKLTLIIISSDIENVLRLFSL